VGKSIWINAVANYLHFNSLEDAVKGDGEFKFPIPCTFTIKDPQTKYLMNISSECNGMTPLLQDEVGQSVTKHPGEHVFQFGDIQINLIDTPGLKDTKGTSNNERDREHVKNILRLLSAYDEMHAICILLKADESKLTETFKYTLIEILRHLDTGACNNVIFILTHVGTSKTENTQSILQKFLNDNKLPISLPPDRPTIYSFENDTMNYITCRKNNIPQDEDDELRNMAMPLYWKKSVTSTRKMLDYICYLKPHSLARINAIYNAEHVISVLSELVLETLVCIFKHMNDLERKSTEAKEQQENIAKNPADFAEQDIRNLLYVERPRVDYTPLGHANVVCKSPDCTELVNGEAIYLQTCCRKCTRPLWLSLYFCDKMTWLARCKVCHCRLRKHKMETVETKITWEKVYQPTESVIAEVIDSDTALKEIEKAISEYEGRMETCRNETTEMLKTCAKLSSFVQQNVLMATSIDDEFLETMRNRIQLYERAHEKSGASYLQKILNEYNQFLAEEKKRKRKTNCYDVHDLIQHLYRLPTNGNNLKTAMETEEEARQMVVDLSKNPNVVIRLGSRCCKQVKSTGRGIVQFFRHDDNKPK